MTRRDEGWSGRVHSTVGLVAAVLSMATPSLAFEPALSQPDIRQALDAGGAMARAHRGFDVRAYTLYSVHDALSLQPVRSSVDAVVVGTPYERVAYVGYESAVDRLAPTASLIAKASAPCTVDFILFAHGADKSDRSFLARFAEVRVRAGGMTLAPTTTDVGRGSTLDTFLLPNGGNADRWIGHVAYRFGLCAVAGAAGPKGTLFFTDPDGRKFSLPFDLADYR